MLPRSLLFFVLMGSAFLIFGQSRKEKRKDRKQENSAQQQPTSRDPVYTKKEFAPKAPVKGSRGPTYESEQQFFERMEKLEKAKRKNEKMLSKPQYSDPLYFGHKRPPKKRKPSKMKFCKECGMRH